MKIKIWIQRPFKVDDYCYPLLFENLEKLTTTEGDRAVLTMMNFKSLWSGIWTIPLNDPSENYYFYLSRFRSWAKYTLFLNWSIKDLNKWRQKGVLAKMCRLVFIIEILIHWCHTFDHEKRSLLNKDSSGLIIPIQSDLREVFSLRIENKNKYLEKLFSETLRAGFVCLSLINTL